MPPNNWTSCDSFSLDFEKIYVGRPTLTIKIHDAKDENGFLKSNDKVTNRETVKLLCEFYTFFPKLGEKDLIFGKCRLKFCSYNVTSVHCVVSKLL